MTDRKNHRVCVEYVNESKPSNSLAVLLDAVQGLKVCRTESELLEAASMAARKLSGADRQTRIFANSEMRANQSPSSPVVKCSDCSHFTGKWCSDHKGVWNGRALQSPDTVHPCEGFHAGQHTPEAIPTPPANRRTSSGPC